MFNPKVNNYDASFIDGVLTTALGVVTIQGKGETYTVRDESAVVANNLRKDQVEKVLEIVARVDYEIDRRAEMDQVFYLIESADIEWSAAFVESVRIYID